MSAADDEQIEQENILWPWLADESMAEMQSGECFDGPDVEDYE